MALKHGGNSQPLIDKEEHRYKNVGAKAVVLYGYDTTTDSYYPVNLTANPDGTYSLSSGEPLLAERYDYSSTTIVYVGEAPVGTAVGTALWTITKFDLTDNTDANAKIAQNVKWTDRAVATYV